MTEEDWEAKAKRFAQMLADASLETNAAFSEVVRRHGLVLEILDEMEHAARAEGLLEDDKEDLYAHRIRKALRGETP